MPVLDPATSPVLAPASAPKKPSVFEDLIDVFYAPSQVFERRRDGDYGAALLLFTLISAALVALFWNALEPAFAAEGTRRVSAMLAKNPNLPAEAMENARRRAGSPSLIVNVLSIGVMTPLIALGSAVLLWIAARFVDAAISFGQAMTAATYSLAPMVLNWLAMGVVGLVRPAENVRGMGSLMLGPSQAMDPDTASTALYGFAQRVDVFNVWSVIVAGIGIAVIGRVTRGKGILAAAIAWAFATALVVGMGAAFG